MTRLGAAAKWVFFHSGLVAVARMLGRNGSTLPILRYHSVSAGASYCSPTIAVTPDAFRTQMAYLAAKYRVVSLDEAVGYLDQDRPFPARTTAITFDDGYLDNFESAFPILSAYGLTATFYVATGPILGRESFWVGWLFEAITTTRRLDRLAEAFPTTGQVRAASEAARREAIVDVVAGEINRSDQSRRKALLKQLSTILDDRPPVDAPSEFMMGPQHLREMARAGMTIGSHTVTHPILASLPDDEAMQELVDSKRDLEDVLQAPVEHLAYPNGMGVPINFNAGTARLAREAGYRSASTSLRGPVARQSDPFALPRQGINDRLDFPAFAFKVEEHRFRSLLRA